jgi:hypothetical protein
VSYPVGIEARATPGQCEPVRTGSGHTGLTLLTAQSLGLHLYADVRVPLARSILTWATIVRALARAQSPHMIVTSTRAAAPDHSALSRQRTKTTVLAGAPEHRHLVAA